MRIEDALARFLIQLEADGLAWIRNQSRKLGIGLQGNDIPYRGLELRALKALPHRQERLAFAGKP